MPVPRRRRNRCKATTARTHRSTTLTRPTSSASGLEPAAPVLRRKASKARYGGTASGQGKCYSAPMTTRIEKDTFGPIEVPADAMWGAQTQRSLQNFKISTEKMPPALIKALAQVKRAAAQVNLDLKVLDSRKGKAIIEAADEVIKGSHDGQFPLAVWQTGSGTQTNMNMNEVLANRASELLGGPRGVDRRVHPNDDVNKSQSSNDVFPSAMNLAAAHAIVRQLKPAVAALHRTLTEKGQT